MEIFIIWLILAVVAGWIAANKKRSGFGVFLLSVLLSPLVGLIVAFAMQPGEIKVSDPTNRSPHCAEIIKREANVCRYCRLEVAEAGR